MRRPHYLRKTSSRAMPREMVVFDTETQERRVDERTVEHILWFGYAAYLYRNRHGNWSTPRWIRFETPLELWQWVESVSKPKKRLSVFCHNGNFDWQSTRIFSELPGLGWECEKAIIEDPPNYFLWGKDNRQLALIDTTNYWQESLAKIGKSVGLDKLPFPSRDDPPDVWERYGKRDVEVLIAALLKRFQWLADNDMGSLAMSQAGQAWTAYRHRFMDHDIFIDDNPKALQMARAAYIGGRTEAFVVGRELHDIEELDVNQMYPSVMRHNDYPTKLHGVYKRPALSEIAEWLRRYCVIAEVLIETEEPIYPQREDFGIVFPVGRFWTTLATPELAHAMEHGHVLSCKRIAVYDCAQIFTRWVEELHEMRVAFAESGDLLSSDYSKKMANSLYGKFGQRGGHEEIIGRTDDMTLHVETEVDVDTGKRYRIRHIAGLILSRDLDDETSDSHPAIAAHVTSYARLLLWKYIQIAGRLNVFYVDTDSLHVNAVGAALLRDHIHPHHLGQLKAVRAVARAIYHGAKDYQLDGITKRKGIRSTATLVAPNTYQQEQWVSLRGSCSAGHTGGPLVRTVRKHLARIYRKGQVAADGAVSPLRRTSGRRHRPL